MLDKTHAHRRAYTKEMHLGDPITSRANARVKALRASFSGKASGPGQLVGIEGEHLIAEALRSEFFLDTVFVRQGSESLLARPNLAGLPQDKVVILSADVFDSAVDTASPQGIAATLMLNAFGARPALDRNGPVLLIESLQDPGNLGTLIRTAAAFDSPFLWLTEDCVNPWSPKVIRASAGSIFHLPLGRGGLSELCASLKENNLPIFAAVAPRPGARSVFDTDLSRPCAVLIGNEGAGLSDQALALADAMVTIPCETESLNAAVAGSVLLYEAMRQRFVKQARA
jgi:TrmH family RNA methyltransferase